MNPAAMRLVAARGGGEAAEMLNPMVRRQATLPPIKINGRSFMQLALIKQTATSLVYKACAPRDNAQLDNFGEGVRSICAVKKMTLGDNAHAARAREELAILKALAVMPDASKHVVMLLDSELQANELKLVMECGDQDLSNWAPTSSFQLLDTLEQAVTALQWMHEVGNVVHLDVKPANFLIFPTMNVKIADFGSAMRIREGGSAMLTSDAPFAGTLDYLAPEALGHVSADGQCIAHASVKTDMWAMGVTIHAMLFGRLPFQENGARDVAAQRRAVSAELTIRAEGFSDVFSDIGPMCLELTQACLRPSPADRPSAASLLHELKSSGYAHFTTAARPRAAAISGSPSTEPPPYSAKHETLPPGWERVDLVGRRSYYVDHNNRRTTWTAPGIESPLPGELPAVAARCGEQPVAGSSPLQGELAVHRESSAISMLSVASQEEAEAELIAAPGTPAMLRRQVTFQSSPGKLDLLFKVLSFIPLSELFRARRVCKSWFQRIDSAEPKGREWWEVCIANGSNEILYDRAVDWKETFRVLSFLGPVMNAPWLFSAALTAGPREDRHPSGVITAEWLTILLNNLRRAAVVSASFGVLFKKFVTLHSGTFPKCCEIMYCAFTQKPPNNHSELAYAWWCSSTPEIAAEIQAKLANSPLRAREAAAASFDSYIKKMIIVLAYLDRFYIPRFHLNPLITVAAPIQAQLRMDLELSAPLRDVA